ncbi:hypothetical protein [Marinithermus hydrothermalis]|uniref:DUF3352 domain-containing protein n=1 Tax=Marinithermus hydrothermalis (strain DSM 14884 / JCM 11576 / T1) TaxID=869210 RepID=F2NMB6_MARHT|nr:hypothetical protein [Marinithermus hydrothermalis]AEB11804.1 hypothetical protein Marky_1062 [Marinithermus hydrothermalis DSM 14884]
MKKILVLLSAFLVSLALAQTLPALTPPGAVAGLYTRNLGLKKTFFLDFQAEWARLGLADWVDQALGEELELSETERRELELFRQIFNLDVVGREGIVTVYPDGNFFALARPSADRVGLVISTLKNLLEEARPRSGWMVQTFAGEEMDILVGYTKELVLVATPTAADRFFAKERGLEVPLEGDLVFWVDPEPLLPLLETTDLPPELARVVRTFAGYATALELQPDGVHTRSRLALSPEGDPELLALLLPEERAWPLEDLAQGHSVTSGVFDLAKFGAYVTQWLQFFGVDYDLDLSAFGRRIAVVTLPMPTDPMLLQQNPLGNMLIYVETEDPITAEVTVLSWLQQAAAFATAEGAGGFKVEPIEADGLEARRVQVGLWGEVYLAHREGVMILATSAEAFSALTGPTLEDDPAFQRFATRIPPNAVSASFTNLSGTLREQAALITSTLPLMVDDPAAMQTSFAIAEQFQAFLEFIAGRVGGGVAYSQVQDHTLESEGFWEVRW